jgi:hypothetical protein
VAPPFAEFRFAEVNVAITTRSKGGRIVFEVALDWSEEKQEYVDVLRLWVSRNSVWALLCACGYSFEVEYHVAKEGRQLRCRLRCCLGDHAQPR